MKPIIGSMFLGLIIGYSLGITLTIKESNLDIEEKILDFLERYGD